MKCYKFKDGIIYNGDCLKVMSALVKQGIKIDFVFADLPYNETGNKWVTEIIYMFVIKK